MILISEISFLLPGGAHQKTVCQPEAAHALLANHPP